MDQNETLQQRLMACALCYLGTAEQARELAANIASYGADETGLEAQIAELLTARPRRFQCSDVRSCAAALAVAFRRWQAINAWDGTEVGRHGIVAVGRKGPAFGCAAFEITVAA